MDIASLKCIQGHMLNTQKHKMKSYNMDTETDESHTQKPTADTPQQAQIQQSLTNQPYELSNPQDTWT